MARDGLCDEWRDAVAARVEGRASTVDDRLLDAHLDHCVSCRSMLDDAECSLDVEGAAPSDDVGPLMVTVSDMPDLSQRITKLNAAADRAASWSTVRILLAVVAAEVVLLSVRALVLGEETDASTHAARHVGAFSLAYGVMLVLVVVRPARARTALPVATVVAGALAITAAVDLVQGRIPLVDEALHIPEIVSVFLIWLIAVPVGDRRIPWRRRGKLPESGLHLVRSDGDRVTR